MKRILTVQDISCVGKCSLTVALPIISAMGVETSVLPTAVLSTHTQFKGFTFRDLTDDIKPIAKHWMDEGIAFDAIYTGYLGSFEQIQLVGELFDQFGGKDSLILIDPVMGDNGKLYTGFTPEFARAMAVLCRKADVIVPNMTEAAAMLGIEYVGEGYDEAYIQDLLKRLTGLGTPCAVLTGVSFVKGQLGVMSYDARLNRYFSYFREQVPVSYHGTGDVYASTVLGALVSGLTLDDALKVAVDYTVECIQITFDDPNRRFYGVNFEQALPMLVRRMESEKAKAR